jgi:hypothetical protein
MSSAREPPLLTARWRNLVVVNYAVDPRIVAPLAPAGTELDLHEGETFLSLVGFLFENTRVRGLVPLWPCSTFEEVNLRFYVRRSTPEGPRRAVCFVREVVPCLSVAWGARILYGEPYVARPMAHRWELDDPRAPESGGRFAYRWKADGAWLEMAARTSGASLPLRPGSVEEFLLDHAWGYTRLRDGGTKEYRVAHPAWRHWKVERADVDPRIASFYGAGLSEALAQPPCSTFVAAGSEVSVFAGRRLSVP